MLIVWSGKRIRKVNRYYEDLKFCISRRRFKKVCEGILRGISSFDHLDRFDIDCIQHVAEAHVINFFTRTCMVWQISSSEFI